MEKICRVKFRSLYSLFLLLLFCAFTYTVEAQTKTINGTIKDPDGIGLPGVNIIIKGTTIGTVSDFDGKYNLVIRDQANPTLVFSFIGFVAQEVVVGNQSVINVTMKTTDCRCGSGWLWPAKKGNSCRIDYPG